MHKMRFKRRKYGPEMWEITPKWRIDLSFEVGLAKIAHEFLESNFWG